MKEIISTIDNEIVVSNKDRWKNKVMYIVYKATDVLIRAKHWVKHEQIEVPSLDKQEEEEDIEWRMFTTHIINY